MKKVVSVLPLLLLVAAMFAQAEKALFAIYGDSKDVRITDMPRHLQVRVHNLKQFRGRFNGTHNIYGQEVIQQVEAWQDQYGIAQRKTVASKVQTEIIKALTNPPLVEEHPAMFKRFVQRAQAEEVRLKYEDGKWYARTKVAFEYKGKEVEASMLLQVEQHGEGWRWAICDVAAPFLLPKEDKGQGFIQPIAHENGFLDMRQAFQSASATQDYFRKDFQYDRRHRFVEIANRGDLQFQYVKATEYYFFQVPGWVFRLSYFNRKARNSGWLISNLEALKGCSAKEYLFSVL